MGNDELQLEKSMLHKLTSPMREFGWLGGLIYAMDRVLARISPAFRLYFYEIMVQPIPDRPLVPPRLTRNLEMREIKRGDPEVDLMPARHDVKESRFAQDAICLGAYRDRAFIGYIWFCFRRYHEDEVRCTYAVTPETQAVFDFDLYIFPQHRMGLGFIGIWNEANKFLRNRGIRYTYSRLTRFNVASRRAHQHLGWKCVGRTIFLQAGPAQIMAATVFPYLHLSVRKSSRVRLTLRPDALTLPGRFATTKARDGQPQAETLHDRH